MISNPKDHLIYLTNRVARQLSAAMLEEMEFEGFRPQGTHLGLIADLAQLDGQRQQDLAIATIKDKGTIARALSQLEEAGFLQRRRDEADRRQKRIYLTERGRRLWQFTNEMASCVLARATAEVTATEMATCLRVLQHVHHNLHQQLTTRPINVHEQSN